MTFLTFWYVSMPVVALCTGQIAVLGMVIPQVFIFSSMAGTTYLAGCGNRVFLDLERTVG